MKIFISIALTAIFLLLDLLAGNLALFPALSGYCAIALLLAYGWSYGIIAALTGGIVLDVMYGHSFAVLGVLFALVTAAAGAIAIRGSRQLPGIFAGGCCAGLLVSVTTAVMCRAANGTLPGPDISSYIIFSTGGGGIVLILQVCLFDFFAARANLPRCIKNTYNEPEHRKNLAMRHKMKNSSRRRK